MEAWLEKWVEEQKWKREVNEILGSPTPLREGTYQLADGRSVYYDDGKETLRDASDLYTVLEELHGTGSPNLENMQARHILDRLQTGSGLGEVHIGTLRGLLDKHRAKIAALRRTRDRDGQDMLKVASDGPDSRISPTETKEADAMGEFDERLVRLREVGGKTLTPGLLGALEIDLGPEDSSLQEVDRLRDSEEQRADRWYSRDAPAPVPYRLREKVNVAVAGGQEIGLREAVEFGQVTLLEALDIDPDLVA